MESAIMWAQRLKRVFGIAGEVAEGVVVVVAALVAARTHIPQSEETDIVGVGDVLDLTRDGVGEGLGQGAFQLIVSEVDGHAPALGDTSQVVRQVVLATECSPFGGASPK